MSERKISSMFLEGSKVYLRPVEEGDHVFINRGENNPVVREQLFLAFPAGLRETVDKLSVYQSSKESIILAIIEKKSHQIVGLTAFFRLDYVSRAAVFYLALLDPQYWSKKYGFETTQLMVRYAFDTLNLNRIQLHVCAENAAAIKIYKKSGFQKEGVLRKAMFRNGKYIDFYVMGLLREDFEQHLNN
ncbi:MAG: GNAT family protein [candidate division KSB1 bacterium]|jgi:RimJ/RimL family protein N-acetyltransferase|nr:GNAT family protein [candidate division KSB1 bacterium]